MTAIQQSLASSPGRDGRIASLDVVRGLAILMVVATHNPVFPASHGVLYKPLVLFAEIGWSGVDLFFVLSGFLVGGLLMREQKQHSRIDAARFLIRRAFKVWPTYFAFLAVYAAVQILDARGGGTAGSRATTLAHDLWPNLVHVQNYFASTSQLGWLWSLAVEEHFYLALPLVLKWVFRDPARSSVGRRMGAVLTTVLVGAFLLRLRAGFITPPSASSAYTHVFPTHLRVDSLFAGVFVAYLIEFHDQWIRRLYPARYVLVIVGIVPWVLCHVFPEQKQVFLYPWGLSLLYMGAACIVTFAYLQNVGSSPERANKLYRWLVAAFAWIGVRSYCIYVWHGYFAKPVANRLAQLFHLMPGQLGVGGWIYDAIYLAVPVLLGGVMYRAIERPGLELRRRFAPGRSPGYAPSPFPSS